MIMRKLFIIIMCLIISVSLVSWVDPNSPDDDPENTDVAYELYTLSVAKMNETDNYASKTKYEMDMTIDGGGMSMTSIMKMDSEFRQYDRKNKSFVGLIDTEMSVSMPDQSSETSSPMLLTDFNIFTAEDILYFDVTVSMPGEDDENTKNKAQLSEENYATLDKKLFGINSDYGFSLTENDFEDVVVNEQDGVKYFTVKISGNTFLDFLYPYVILEPGSLAEEIYAELTYYVSADNYIQKITAELTSDNFTLSYTSEFTDFGKVEKTVTPADAESYELVPFENIVAPINNTWHDNFLII